MKWSEWYLSAFSWAPQHHQRPDRLNCSTALLRLLVKQLATEVCKAQLPQKEIWHPTPEKNRIFCYFKRSRPPPQTDHWVNPGVPTPMVRSGARARSQRMETSTRWITGLVQRVHDSPTWNVKSFFGGRLRLRSFDGESSTSKTHGANTPTKTSAMLSLRMGSLDLWVFRGDRPSTKLRLWSLTPGSLSTNCSSTLSTQSHTSRSEACVLPATAPSPHLGCPETGSEACAIGGYPIPAPKAWEYSNPV